MEIKDFIKNFAEAMDDMDASSLAPETVFSELDDWSSMSVLALISMADTEYDVELEVDQIRNSRTIQDLFNLIKSASEGL